MTDWTFRTLQAKGKVRRFIQATFLHQDNESLLARRSGECNRCGACCKILYRCPFLGTDEEGQYTCRVYHNRPAQCRLYPLHARDLLELTETCTYTFDAEPAKGARATVPACPSTAFETALPEE